MSLHSKGESNISTHDLAKSISSLDPGKVMVALRDLQDIPLDAEFGNHLMKDVELATSICKWLAHGNSGNKNDPVCSWFYDCYQSDVPEMQLFVLAFLPALLWNYITLHSSETPISAIETVLLGIYSIELVSRGDAPKIFTLPSSSLASVYHTPALPESVAKLTEDTLRAVNREPSGPVLREPRLQLIQDVTISDRSLLVDLALSRYQAVAASLPVFSLFLFCQFTAKLSRVGVMGLTHLHLDESLLLPDIEGKTEDFLLAILPEDYKRNNSAVYIVKSMKRIVQILAICGNRKESRQAAMEAGKNLHARSVYEAIPDAVLVTSSLLQAIPAL